MGPTSSACASAPRRIVTALAATALAAGLLVAVPTSPAAAAGECSPWSTLACDQLTPALPFTATFDGGGGGLADTALRVVQPSTAGAYLPSRLSLTSLPGSLTVSSTAGIQYQTPAVTTGTNSLDNALAIGVEASGRDLSITTTLTSLPVATNKSEQAGLWFGPDQDNYVKLVAISQSGGTYRVQLVREVAGVGSTAVFGTDAIATGAGSVLLELVAQPGLSRVQAFATVGALPRRSIGTQTVPAGFFDGSLLPGHPRTMTSTAGIMATHRSNTTAGSAGLPFSFGSFSVTGTDAAAPAVISGLAAAAGDSAVSVSWNASSELDVAGYRVFRATSLPVGTGGSPVSGDALLASPSFVDTGVVNGTTYHYSVQAVDVAGRTSPDAPAVSATPSAAAPPTLTGLVASPGDRSALLSWAPSSEGDLAGYRVYRATSLPVTTSSALLTPTLLTSPTFTDSGLAVGTTYHYAVTAVDASANESSISTPVTVTGVAVAPAAPTGLTLTGSTATLTAAWTPNSEPDVAGYRVYASATTPVPTSGTPASGVTLVAGSSFALTGLVDGTTYHVVVVAVDAQGDVSAVSAEASGVPAGIPVLTLENRDGLPYSDRLVSNRIGTPANPQQVVHDKPVMRVRNTGASPLVVSAITLTGAWVFQTAPVFPVTIAPGAFSDVALRFTANYGPVRTGTMVITSNAGSRTVALAGYWSRYSENTEPTVAQLLQVMGYTTILPTIMSAGYGAAVANSADEVLAPYWRRVNGASPVVVDQLAAFHTYPAASTVRWANKGQTATPTQLFRQHSYDAQALLPRNANSSTARATGSFSPTGPFTLGVDTVWGDASLNSDVEGRLDGCTAVLCGQFIRAFKARDRNGAIVPNTYVMVMDYSGINYDYNDNVYLVSNVAPESSWVPTGVQATAANTSVDLRWDAPVMSGLSGWEVLRDNGSHVTDASPVVSGVIPVATTSFADANLTNGNLYAYAVRGVFPDGSRTPLSATSTAIPLDPNGFHVTVNFQSCLAPVPLGDLRDCGEAYGPRGGANQGTGLTYGWVRQGTTTAVNLSVGGSTPGNGRDRNLLADQRLDTTFVMQPSTTAQPFNGTNIDGAWRMAVPNGSYLVTVGAGDPLKSSAAEVYVLRAETQVVLGPFTPTGNSGTSTRRVSGSLVVQVTDGVLDVDAIGGTNTKLNYVEVQSL